MVGQLSMELWNMNEQGYRKGLGDVFAVILFHCLGLDERLLEVINAGRSKEKEKELTPPPTIRRKP